ncbi:MAG: hypothetical protein ACT4NY_28235 [Pseudonocardiales bacterium]
MIMLVTTGHQVRALARDPKKAGVRKVTVSSHPDRSGYRPSGPG